MNKLLSLALLIVIFSTQSSHAVQKGTNSTSHAHKSDIDTTTRREVTYSVIPFKSYQLIEPQNILATFQIKCFERFISLIRHDVQTSASEVTTVLGAIVEVTPHSVCSDAEDITVDAGWAFSGRQQKIVSIDTLP